jgi:hypothetical protein
MPRVGWVTCFPASVPDSRTDYNREFDYIHCTSYHCENLHFCLFRPRDLPLQYIFINMVEMATPRKLWQHADPESTAMWKFMQKANQKRGLSMQVSRVGIFLFK